MIELDGITFAYPGGDPPLFRDFHWRVCPGETWAVVGPSGTGKSTLLQVMTGLLLPQRGCVRADGRPLHTPSTRTALVFQDYELLPWATVRANAELGLRIQRRRHLRRQGEAAVPDRAARRRLVAAWLERLGIAELAERYPHQLSGGQRQRCALARAFATRPARLLMDEPFSALDAATREKLQVLTLDLCAGEGVSAVLVTHAIEEAIFFGQRLLLMRPGRPVRTEIVDNAHDCRESFRSSAEFLRRCRALREKLP